MRNYFVLFVAVFICSQAFAKTESEFKGPLGLKWGMTSAEVDKQVEGKLKFLYAQKRGEPGADPMGDELRAYRGDFGGFETELVQMEFFQEKLFAFSVKPRSDSKSVALFDQVIAKIKSKYGNGDRSPASKATGRGATWNFSNDSKIVVEESQDAKRSVSWAFFQPSSLKKATEVDKMNPPKKAEEKKVEVEADGEDDDSSNEPLFKF